MNKKIIIIEGPDNCGKDSLINKLKDNFKNPMIIHAGVPRSDCSLFDFYYDGLIHNTLDAFYDKEHDAVIHNRSMYGEFVYGPKYRGKSPSEIAKMIYKLEAGQLKTFILSNELYFILLTSTDANLLANNDDGKSLSNKVDDIKDEIDAFNTIFNLSEIENKKKIYVNEGSSFRDKDIIYNEVMYFINE